MDIAGFWRIVAAIIQESGESCHERVSGAIEKLSRLGGKEIFEFNILMEDLFREAYRWDLWAAAYLINDGCSDSGFYAFRGWLMTQGQGIYEAALRNPDSLADHPSVPTANVFQTLDCEDFLSTPSTAYERVSGKPIPLDESRPPAVLVGAREWDFKDDNEMRRRLPRLWAITESR